MFCPIWDDEPEKTVALKQPRMFAGEFPISFVYIEMSS